jgi:hypothetical protein
MKLFALKKEYTPSPSEEGNIIMESMTFLGLERTQKHIVSYNVVILCDTDIFKLYEYKSLSV